jgi:membrane protease YdiL (CAAX protease family)
MQLFTDAPHSLAVRGVTALLLWAFASGLVMILSGGRHPITVSRLLWLPLSQLVSIVINILIASVGEEIGWRGYLFPRLLSLGVWPAMLLSGIMHALWHLPLIYLTPFCHADGAPWL